MAIIEGERVDSRVGVCVVVREGVGSSVMICVSVGAVVGVVVGVVVLVDGL